MSRKSARARNEIPPPASDTPTGPHERFGDGGPQARAPKVKRELGLFLTESEDGKFEVTFVSRTADGDYIKHGHKNAMGPGRKPAVHARIDDFSSWAKLWIVGVWDPEAEGTLRVKS